MAKVSWIRVLLWLLPRRVRASWLLLGISSFGILAAVILMAIGAIYSRALAEGGLRHTLATTSTALLDGQVIVQKRPLGLADYQNLQGIVEEFIDACLGHTLLDKQRFGRTQPNLTLVLGRGQERSPEFDPIGQPFFLTQFENHTRIVGGRWPQTVPPRGDGQLRLEVVVGDRTAAFLGWRVGSESSLIPFRSNPSERITLTVVGLAEPADPDDRYWMGASSIHFDLQEFGENILVPIYVREADFFGGMGARYPSLLSDYGWSIYVDASALNVATVKPTKEAVVGLETDINKQFPRSLVLTGLGTILSDYEKDLKHARVPLFVFMSLVVLVILYFLALVAGLLARIQGAEASLLRSRGASRFQVVQLLVLVEGGIALLAMVVGPFLALLIVRHLLLGTINPAGGGEALSAGLSADMFVLGAIGGALSLGALVFSGVGLARVGMVEFLRVRARPPTVPLLQRYYVDVLVLAAVGILWWQIQGRGGFVERDILGEALEVDSSLLLGPVLVILAAAFLLLRILPLLARAMAWVGVRLAPAWVSFALARIARDPLPHGSLAIILMMASALGVFGATFQSTLTTSERERAQFEVGGDLVIESPFLSRASQVELTSIPGVHALSPVGRDPITLLDGFPGFSAELLTVDPETLHRTAWFRDDFADKSLSELLRSLRFGEVSSGRERDGHRGTVRSAPNRILLPEDADGIGIWVNEKSLIDARFIQKLSLWMRVSDFNGRHRNLSLGDIPSPRTGLGGGTGQGWTYFEALLPVDESFAFEPPFSIVSLLVGRGSQIRMQPGSIGLDDITVKRRGEDAPANRTVIEGFEETGTWQPIPSPGQSPDTLDRTPSAARSGRFGLTFSWYESAGDVRRGIFIPPGPFPLPAIGGPMFRAGQELRFKSRRQLVPVVVREVTEYFPTISPPSRPFLLVSQGDYEQYIRIMGGSPKPPQEFWVSLDDSLQRADTVLSMKDHLPRFASLKDRDAEVELAQHNPLAGGGWNGLTIISISALTLAVVLALGTYAVVSISTSRLDLTITRALGFSRSQLLASLALERIVMAVVAVAAGTTLGIWMGRWVLGFLDITAGGQPVVPPMLVTVQGWLVALVMAELAVALLVAILIASLGAIKKLRAADILRAGV